MRLIDRYVLPPGCCLRCRGSQRPDEPAVVDMGIDITDGPYSDGHAYLCRSCSVEIAMLWGFAPPELVARYTEERDAAICQVHEVAEENSGLHRLLAAVEAFRPAPEVELAATGKYHCYDCDRPFQNPQGLGRHRQVAHGEQTRAIARGDDALTATEPVEVEA